MTTNGNRYIATFFSHFGAGRFKRELGPAGNDAKLMPVPRFLSSSCGTCCSFSCECDVSDLLPGFHTDEIEQIVLMTGPEEFTRVYEAG